MAQELRVSIAYAEEEFGGEARQVILVGGGAGVPGIHVPIGESLGVHTIVTSPAAVVTCPPGLAKWADDPSLMTAMGLAMYCEGGEA